MNCYNRIKKRIVNFISYIDTFHNNHLDNYLFNDIIDNFEPIMQDPSPLLEQTNTEPSLEQTNTEPSLEQTDTEPSLEQTDTEPLLETNKTKPSLEQTDTEPPLDTVDMKHNFENFTTLKRRLHNIKPIDIDDKNITSDITDNFDKQKERYGRFHSQVFVDDLYDDADEMLYQALQLILRYSYCDKIQNLFYYIRDSIKPNAIRMIMCLVWLYSWALFQFAKATEFFFRNLIRFPEQLFIFVDTLCSQPKNTNDKNIHVLSAFNETGDITNRFKLFLWKYWNTSREVHDENGVDISKFIKLFNCTMLYCSYLLTDPSNLEQEYEQQVKRMLITKQEAKGKFQRFTKKDLKFASVSSSRDSQKSHEIINDEFLHDIIMEGADNDLQAKETNLLFSHCTFE